MSTKDLAEYFNSIEFDINNDEMVYQALFLSPMGKNGELVEFISDSWKDDLIAKIVVLMSPQPLLTGFHDIFKKAILNKESREYVEELHELIGVVND